ncbi:MAG: DUF4405 domain-containing protein [Synoicihabitans sp.]
MKHYVNFALLFAFAILVGSAFLRFFEPFSLVVTSIHIVFGTVVLVLVGFHLIARLGYFKRMLSAPRDTSRPRGAAWRYIIYSLIPCLYLLLACFFRWKPVPQLLALGHEAKNRAVIFRPESDTAIRHLLTKSEIKRQATDQASLMVEIEWGRAFDPAHYFPGTEGRTQIAVWAETRSGTLIETFFVSETSAFSENPEWAGNEQARVDILPIWRNQFTLVSGVSPDGEVDTYAGATPDHSFSIQNNLVDAPEGFYLCVEVNAPGDPNAFYHADQPETAAGYTRPGIGQPSLYYSAFIEPQSNQKYYLLELAGQGGSNSQQSGPVYYNLDEVTTAREIIEKVLVRIEKPVEASD